MLQLVDGSTEMRVCIDAPTGSLPWISMVRAAHTAAGWVLSQAGTVICSYALIVCHILPLQCRSSVRQASQRFDLLSLRRKAEAEFHEEADKALEALHEALEVRVLPAPQRGMTLVHATCVALPFALSQGFLEDQNIDGSDIEYGVGGESGR